MDKKEKAQSIKESFHSIYEKHFSNLTSDLKEKLYSELEQMYSNHSEEEREKVFSFIECKLNLDQRKQLLSEFYLNHAESTYSQIISFFQDTDKILNKICQQQNISEADLVSKGFSDECSLPEDPFFVSSDMKEALDSANGEINVAAEYLENLLRWDPSFNLIIRNTVEYPTSLKWHKNIRAIEELKQNTFALFNNNEEKKEFLNSTPTSSEVYESQLAIFDARHSHLRNEIERSYKHWQEVRKSHGEEYIMWQKQEFLELKELVKSFNSYRKVFNNDPETNNLVADELLNRLHSALNTCQKWDSVKQQKLFGKHPDRFDRFLKSLESYLHEVTCPDTTPGNPVTHKIMDQNNRWSVLEDYQEQFVYVNWDFSEWYIISGQVTPDIFDVYSEFCASHRQWLEQCSILHQNSDYCRGVPGYLGDFHTFTRGNLQRFDDVTAVIDSQLYDFWYFNVNNNSIEVLNAKGDLFETALNFGDRLNQPEPMGADFVQENIALISKIDKTFPQMDPEVCLAIHKVIEKGLQAYERAEGERALKQYWSYYTTAVESKYTNFVDGILSSILNGSTGSNDSALLNIRAIKEANASFNYVDRIGRARGRMPGTDVPSDLKELWDELVCHTEEQMRNTFFIIVNKIKSAWDTVLSQRLDYVKGKVRAIDELMVYPDAPENYEQLTIFLEKWTRINDGDVWLIVSQYPEYLQVTILMVTLVVLTKIFKKLSKKT